LNYITFPTTCKPIDNRPEPGKLKDSSTGRCNLNDTGFKPVARLELLYIEASALIGGN
jgi:hypothetical protein